MEKTINRIVVGDIQTNCWLYPVDEISSLPGTLSCAVIDPGDEDDQIIARIRELNWLPHYIFLTHGHLDHLAALPLLLKACEKTWGVLPKIGIHRLDAHYLGKDSQKVHRESLRAAGGSAFADALWKPMPNADLILEEGDLAGPFRILHLPGHSPGSIGFYDERAGVLFSGDTLFKGDWGRTDLPGGDESKIRQSLKRLLSMKGEIAVFPGHGPATTINDEAGLLGS